MTSTDAVDPMRRNLGRFHTVGGILLGLLTLARLVALRRAAPLAALELPTWHRRGIVAIHALLYVVVLATLVTGLVTVLRVRAEWHPYLLGELARPPSFDSFTSRKAHGVLAWVLVSLVSAHVVGIAVLELRKQRTLRRMLPFLR